MADSGKVGGIVGGAFSGANALMKLGLGIKQLVDPATQNQTLQNSGIDAGIGSVGNNKTNNLEWLSQLAKLGLFGKQQTQLGQ